VRWSRAALGPPCRIAAIPSNQNELDARLSEDRQEFLELGTYCFWSLRLSRDVFPAPRSSDVNRIKLVNF
jgi:hypothetical protein